MAAMRAALLGGSAGGTCFAVAAQRQQNVCVASARGLALPDAPAAAQRVLGAEAARVAEDAAFPFPSEKRACHEYRSLRAA